MCSFRITQSIASKILEWRKEYPFSSIHGGSDGSPAHVWNNHCVWWDKGYWLESWSQERQGPSFPKPGSRWEVILKSMGQGTCQYWSNLPLLPLSGRYPKCGLWATSITREPEDFWAPTETHWTRNPILIVFHVILCVLSFENHSSIWRVPYTFSRSAFFLQSFCEMCSEPGEGITHYILGWDLCPW